MRVGPAAPARSCFLTSITLLKSGAPSNGPLAALKGGPRTLVGPNGNIPSQSRGQRRSASRLTRAQMLRSQLFHSVLDANVLEVCNPNLQRNLLCPAVEAEEIKINQVSFLILSSNTFRRPSLLGWWPSLVGWRP